MHTYTKPLFDEIRRYLYSTEAKQHDEYFSAHHVPSDPACNGMGIPCPYQCPWWQLLR